MQEPGKAIYIDAELHMTSDSYQPADQRIRMPGLEDKEENLFGLPDERGQNGTA